MHVSLLCSSTLHDDQQLHTCIANHEPVIITSYWYFHNHPLNNVQCVCVEEVLEQARDVEAGFMDLGRCIYLK